jgi:hypothetical protein
MLNGANAFLGQRSIAQIEPNFAILPVLHMKQAREVF